MTFQFRTKKESVSPPPINQELQHQMTLLREYNSALQKENETRNEQRKALQLQIERLSKLEREWKSQITVNSSTISSVSIFESRQYLQMKQSYSQLQSRYDLLVIQNSSLSNRLRNADYSSSLLLTYQKDKTQLSQKLRSTQIKIVTLQSKVTAYEYQISQLKLRAQGSSVTVTKQFQQRIDGLENQLKIKSDDLLRMGRDMQLKDQQLISMRNQINAYSMKINALSEELDRLQKSQTHKIQTIRIVQNEQVPVLRVKIDQLNAINVGLNNANARLREESDRQLEYIRDMERRIMILEDANGNLQRELRAAIEAKKNVSKVTIVQEDTGLKEALFSLRAELKEVRNFNQLVRQQNQELSEQLDRIKLQSQTHQNHHCHCKHSYKSRSRSPIGRGQKQTLKYVLNEAQPNYQSGLTYNITDVHSPFQQVVSRRNNTSQQVTSNIVVSDRYNDLQKKIRLLQNENKTLKGQLIYEI